MVWVFVFGGIALAGLVMLISYGVWLAHKAAEEGNGPKAAMLPLHAWLPNAYAYAPSWITAFLSATATKVAIYLLVRFVFSIFGVTIDFRPTIADGLMPTRPGTLNFEHVRAFVDDIVCVSDAAIADAAAQLMYASKLVVEFSGAATVAALLSGACDVRGRRVAAVLSGGNMDPARALAPLTA